uniref:Uncharacterized protein n=1 Tax=Magallana gigas TaxID=29159 RepID=A0A8W8ILP3_MAGGI
MIGTENFEEEMIVTLEIVLLLVKTETLETEELHLEKTVGDLIVIGRVSLIDLHPEKKETGVEVVDGKTDGEEVVVVVVVKNAVGVMHGKTGVRRMEEMKEEEGPGEEAELETPRERKRDGAGEMTEDQQEGALQFEGALDVLLLENLRKRKMMVGLQCVIEQTDKPRLFIGGG